MTYKICYNITMIAYLDGQIIDKTLSTVIIDVGGVGYEVMVSPAALEGLVIGAKTQLHIAENIREDGYSLLGFTDKEQRQLYFQLTSVNGVGPKAALAILSAHSVSQISGAIAAGQSGLFSSVSGIGAKTAARIIIDLKGKLDLNLATFKATGDPVYQALLGLGYNAKQAQSMMAELPPELSTEEKIKYALRQVKS